MFSSCKSVLSIFVAGAVLSGCQSVSEKPDQTNTVLQPTSTVTVNKTKQVYQSETAAASDLWALTRQHMQLDLHLDQARVQNQLNWYKKHPTYMDRIVKRATPYYHYIVHEAIKRGIPTELALLPIVESAFDPFAYSHGRAAGPWQFIPSTGKHFGLEQTWWYDGRRDIKASTEAAFTYLQQLNKRFDGDWLLALAAYNAGGGNVSKAIKRNLRSDKATDYWSLKLPKETMAYVPKLLAIAELVKNSDVHGLTLKEIPNTPYFTSVDIGSQIDLAQAAEMAGISIKEIYQLNPGFNRWATSPDGPHTLLIPTAQATQFQSALENLPEKDRVKWTRYKVKSGDSLIGIASKFDTTVAQIRKSNKISGNRIRSGQTLMISRASQQASEYTLSQQQRHIEKQKTISRTTDRKEQYHTVRSGDSFWSIARKYQVGVRQLARWNSMAPGDALRVGKRLVIWSKPTQTALSSSDRQIIRKVGYKVRSGDSLSLIADKFNVRVADILSWNKLNKKRYLQPGQRLTLYVDVTRTH